MQYEDFFRDLSLKYNFKNISAEDKATITDILKKHNNLKHLVGYKVFIDFWIQIIHEKSNYNFVQEGKLISDFTDIDASRDFFGIEYNDSAIYVYPVISSDPTAYEKPPEERYSFNY